MYAGLAQVWQIGSRFVLTPVIIAKVGLEGYGTWTLLFGICAYVSMFNTSFGFAYSKFTAEHDRKKDYAGLSEIIGSGIVLIGGLAFLALSVIWLVRTPILRVLNVPENLLSDAGLALLIVAVCVLLRMSFGCVFQVLAGLQRMDLQYKLMILASALDFLVAFTLLVAGYGLLALAIGHFCGQVLAMGIAWILCRRLCPVLRISPFCLSRSGLRHIVSLGGRFQLLSFLTTVFRQGTKMLLSGLCGIVALAVFELAEKLLMLAGSAAGAIIGPMMPAFAHLHAGQEHDRWQALYNQGSRILSCVCVGSFAFVALFADRAIVLWTGQEYPLAAWTIRALTATYFLTMLSGVATASLRGRGTVRLETWCVIIGIFIFGALVAPAYWLAGYKGMVLALACGSVSTIWLMFAFARQESLPVVNYFRDVVVRPVLVGAPAVACTLALGAHSRLDAVGIPGRGGLVLELGLWGVGFAIAIGLSLWWGVLSHGDRRALIEFIASRRRSAPALQPAPSNE